MQLNRSFSNLYAIGCVAVVTLACSVNGAWFSFSFCVLKTIIVFPFRFRVLEFVFHCELTC